MKGQLAVLFDHSRSMTVGYRSGVRLDAVEAAARAMGKEGFAAPLYAFGDEAVPISRAELVDSQVNLRDRTDLTASIRSVLDEDVDRSLGAVLVVSDGSDAAALEAAQSLRDYGVRIHTVSVGGDEVLNDDSIRSVDADPIGFLRQEGVLRVTVRSAQPSRSTIPLTLRLGEEVLRETQVPLNALGEGTVELPFVPQTLGRNVYRLTLGLTPEDSVPENNERYVLIRVLRDRLRVLLVAGRPSWDVRFLRAFLKRDPAIDLISFFILRTGSDLTMAAPEQLALIPFPTDELFREHLGSFDVIVFQNFDYGPYQMAMYLPQIRNYVRRGGAFAMIGGEQSFASGGYGGTPVAEILPVRLPSSDAASEHLLDSRRFRPKPSTEFAAHPIVELQRDAISNEALWGSLAPAHGVNVIAQGLESSQALLVHPNRNDETGAPMPVLVLGTYERGRTLALAIDSSWRWGITTGGLLGDASLYDRFWDRALRWLARDPALEPSQITTHRERYGIGSTVRVSARLRDERYLPIVSGQIRLSVEDGSGALQKTLMVSSDREGRLHAEFPAPSEAGGYRVIAEVQRGRRWRTLGEEWFVVELGGDELADPEARPDVLKQLSLETGGDFFSDWRSVGPLRSLNTKRVTHVKQLRVAPFRSFEMLLFFGVLLTVEWTLRRRWGRP